MYNSLELFFYLMVVNTVGMFTSFMQKIIVFRTKDNVTLNTGQILLELSITVMGLLYILTFTKSFDNKLVSDVCGIS